MGNDLRIRWLLSEESCEKPQTAEEFQDYVNIKGMSVKTSYIRETRRLIVQYSRNPSSLLLSS